MGSVTVHLRSDAGWAAHGTGRARGRAFRDGRLLDAPALARIVDESPGSLETLAESLVGEFALIHVGADAVAAAVDPVGTRPLFYAVEGDRALVGDSPRLLAGALDGLTFDPVAEFEFLLGGIVSGRDTLYEELSRVQAGEVIRLDTAGESVTETRQDHFEFVTAGRERSQAELLDELDVVLRRAVDRLVEVADGRQIAVPLSGGYDSRLVACLLARRGYPRVTTFSFGRGGNPESAISERVAGELGLPWSFAEYSDERWRVWYGSADRRAYYASAFDWSSTPSIGTCPALDDLAARGALADDAVIVSGDSITTTGEHVPARFGEGGPGSPAGGKSITRADVIDEILDIQYDLWDHAPADTTLLRARVADRLGTRAIVDGETAATALEAWDWRERQSKFIVSPEEYAYGGYDSWLPLFDREYMAFWQTVPRSHRIGKSLHVAYVDSLFAAQSRTGTAVTADRSRYGMTGRLKQLVADSPLARVAEPLYHAVTGETPRARDHLAGLGIVPPPVFRQLYTGRESVHSFKALDLTGRVSLAPPAVRRPPDDGVVTFDADDAEALEETRRRLPWFVTA